MKSLEKLFSRRRFGMKMGLETMRSLLELTNTPYNDLEIIHIAGTNGKGAVAAMLDSIFNCANSSVFRYTSPHLLNLNERFFLNGAPIDNETLESAASIVVNAAEKITSDVTFFEALTATAVLIASKKKSAYKIFECGLGGRLDATNILNPRISVITRLGLDHCDYLGNTIKEIAIEKAGIIKPGVPIVMGENDIDAINTIKEVAERLSAPFYYAPDLIKKSDLPSKIMPPGAFNRENAITALAVAKVIGFDIIKAKESLSNVIWPGRFQQIGDIIVDGAHNPPAAKALANEFLNSEKVVLVAGFCSDKDVKEVLKILSPITKEGFAVKTSSERSLTSSETMRYMQESGIKSQACKSLDEALAKAKSLGGKILITGSLYLAGEALVKLGAYPWKNGVIAPGELLKATN
ncbi:MAG: bifunctional folylpolyglutamate synthase/dihydrofolate synthase [Kiritimatiellae bacterium]|nr:bifunctional folylpolyglutamate synthase/dihydrofolate synthase [Kiritimatiellia bacterium]